MKLIKPLVLLAISSQLLNITPCSAQIFNVIKATRQNWAGGVAGRSGSNYYIELTTKSKTTVPDTVWINDKVYPINFSVNDGHYILTIDSINHQIKYIISVGETRNLFGRPTHSIKDTTAKNEKPARAFNGAAMISYMEKHKQRFFIIKSFTILKQLNYP